MAEEFYPKTPVHLRDFFIRNTATRFNIPPYIAFALAKYVRFHEYPMNAEKFLHFVVVYDHISNIFLSNNIFLSEMGVMDIAKREATRQWAQMFD